MFRETLAAAVGLEKPIDLPEDATEEQVQLYTEAMKFYEEQIKQLLLACLQAQQIPPE